MDFEDVPTDTEIPNDAPETPLSASPQIDRKSAPDSAPSPLSYWIDLHPIAEHAGPSPRIISMSLDERVHLVPDVAPEPLSHWLDLLPIDYSENPIPEVSPERASLFPEPHHEPQIATNHSQEPLSETRTVSMSLDERRTQQVPEVPPVPISHWIDLYPVVQNESIPEFSPEPASLFLELNPERSLPVVQEAADIPLPLATESPAEAVSDDIILSLGNSPIAPSNEEVATADHDQVDVQKRGQQATEPSICRYPDCMPDGTRYMATSDADMDRHYQEYHA
ncbi:hypothetical protein HWV62_5413 [Athelia sp. TMB]|nr:hypothetical protein HWV62_5413 [Athelia sp. TMB]